MPKVSLHSDLNIAVSTVRDGIMRALGESEESKVEANRKNFLANNGIMPSQTALVKVVYEGSDYCRYAAVSEADSGNGITGRATQVNDALATQAKGLAILLPLADCIGAVLYDVRLKVLMVSHLGRHSLEQYGATNSVKYMTSRFGSSSDDIVAWLSPAAGGDNYPLYSFENRSMHDVATRQLLMGGVSPGSIKLSPVDTTLDENYFSHSEYKKGNRPIDGRFAIVAMIRPL